MKRWGNYRLLFATLLGLSACSSEAGEGLSGKDAGVSVRDSGPDGGPPIGVDGEIFPDATECGEDCDELTLSGRTVLSNGAISVSAGGNVVAETVADARGRYTVQLALGGDLQRQIVVQAFDGAKNRYASLAGSLGELLNAAGADRFLDERECIALVISELSTARWAGVHDSFDDAELNRSLDGTTLAYFAAVLRTIRVQEPPLLPLEFVDTLQLAENRSAVQEMVLAMRAAPESLVNLQARLEEVLAETNNLAGLGQRAVNSHLEDMHPGRDGTGRWDFTRNLEGTHQPNAPLVYLDGLETFRWSSDNGFVGVDFEPDAVLPRLRLTRREIQEFTDDPVLQMHIDSRLPSEGMDIPRTKLSAEIRFIYRSDKIDWVSVHETITWHFDQVLPNEGVNMPAVTRTQVSLAPVWRRISDLRSGPLMSGILNGAWFMRIFAPLDLDSTEVSAGTRAMIGARIEFPQDGGPAIATYGETGQQLELTFAFSSQSGLIVGYPGGESQSSLLLKVDGDTYGILTSFTEGGRTYSSYARDVRLDPAVEVTEQFLTNDANEFWQSSLDLGRGFDIAPGGAVERIGDELNEMWSWSRTPDSVVQFASSTRRVTWTPGRVENGRIWMLEQELTLDTLAPRYVTPPRLLYYSPSELPR